MSEKVRVGVIGTSAPQGTGHLLTLGSHPQVVVAAICGRNRSRAEEVARKHEIPAIFTDYREMIEKGNLDALVIVTPDDLHYPMTMAGLDARLHVLCEKPMASNASQAREMVEKGGEGREAYGLLHVALVAPLSLSERAR